MDIRKEYETESGKGCLDVKHGVLSGLYTNSYVYWLEAKIKQLQEASSNSDYSKSCETCVYGVDGCQHEPPCTSRTGYLYYKKRDFS